MSMAEARAKSTEIRAAAPPRISPSLLAAAVQAAYVLDAAGRR
jgi:hypothetical protein